MRKYLLFMLTLQTFSLFAQDGKPKLVYDNMLYDKRIQTVIFSKLNVDDRYPMIALNSAEQLQLSFDILGNKNEYFQYTLVHCDANWNPTNLQQNEYLQGSTFEQITDVKFSNNTFVKYVHYTLVLPNENLKPMIAGNFLVKVYRNFDEDDLVLTRKMLVINVGVNIEGKATMAQTAQNRYTKQEINFSVNYKGYTMPNPFEDVKVVVMQNGRWDNSITGVKPMFIRDNVLDYNFSDQFLFNGGNEFRYFDMRNLRAVSINVRGKTLDTVYHVYLINDESRGSKQYVQYIDNDGKRVIANKDNGTSGELDGDYAFTNFYLMSMDPVPQDVYVFGDFTDWKLLPEYKMRFNTNRGRYDLEVPLKQGRYEYFYVVKDENGKPSETTFEGSSSQAENEYLILVYHKNVKYKYDELIGAAKFTTTM
jgi:Domain of unknown function (DUF5103)